MKSVRHKCDAIIDELKGLGNASNREGMARFGIATEHAFGVSIPVLRRIAKRTGRNHALALELWRSAFHEARILAAFVDDPTLVSSSQMDLWVKDFDSWDLTDQCCNHLFSRSSLASGKVHAWSCGEEEFVRRAAFSLLASMAVHRHDVPDEDFESMLTLVLLASEDDRNYVRKAVSWALRQIGKRSPALHAEAISVAEALCEKQGRTARWIGRDALRELQDPSVYARIIRRANSSRR